MKKFLLVAFSVLLLIFNTACPLGGGVTKCTFYYDEMIEIVNKIEICWLPTYASDEQIELLYTLKQEEISEFLEIFCSLSYNKRVPPARHSFTVIKLYYNDGACDWISASGGARYNNGEFAGYAPYCSYEDRRPFYNLISKYTEIHEGDVVWALLKLESV